MAAVTSDRLDVAADAEITAAALADQDALPITPEQVVNWRPPAMSKRIRHNLGMTRARFSTAYGIPIETLRGWESHAAGPTVTELAYLPLIEQEPELAKLVPEET